MTVETATKISQLNPLGPPGSDPKSEGDNHIRLIKSCLQAVFDDSVAGIIKFTGNSLSTTGSYIIVDAANKVRGTIDAVKTAGDGGLLLVAKDETGDVKASMSLMKDGLYISPDDTTKVMVIDQSRQLTGTTRKFYLPAAAIDTVAGIWEPIANVSFSAVALFDIKDLAPFKKLRWSGAVALSAANALCFRSSADNGVSFSSGASDYSFVYVTAAGTTSSVSSAAAAICNLSNTIDAGTTVHFIAQIENFNVASGDKGVNVDTKQRVGGVINKSVWGNAINLTPAQNALRLLPSTGGTMTGNFLLEGVRG